MAYQKLQGSTALELIPSDNNQIPFPSKIVTSTADGTSANQLVDSSQDFIALRVKAGDIVYDTTGNKAARVNKVVDANTLNLNDNIMVSGDDYIIYDTDNDLRSGNGAVLYCGGIDGNIKVETIGGDLVTFIGLKAGTFLPVQVRKVFDTDTTMTNLLAIW